MDVSFCIVNLNSKLHIQNCISSISDSIKGMSYEINIADNNSIDGSLDLISMHYSSIKLIKNTRNIGYTKAINQLLKVSRGNYLAILNPDTILSDHSIYQLIKYISNRRDIGIIGPKVVNINGNFQKSCRRGLARPKAVFSYFLGLSEVFPSNKHFTGYHLNHLDENEINEVSGVSGSCMIIKRKVIEEIGYFDERFFAYQEDSDYCIRAMEHGWKVYYYPQAVVKHHGGMGGSNSVPFKAIFEWHRSYVRFYFKHFSKEHGMVFNMVYLAIMVIKLIFSEFKKLISI